ncbi:MAG: hypothetical protein IGBAC_0227 [Ignavibacteriae bacterium]|nr:MAG: hypothetical protein IGBAC_0227 [Ignavibacteriota bacterium]
MSLIVIYLFYSFISQQVPEPKQDPTLLIDSTNQIIQIEILNGSGIKGAGAKFTNYLRKNGVDVIDVRNYKTSSLENTIIIDRIGDIKASKKIAQLIGITEKNILQQINPDYFVSITLILGKDCTQLKPMM